VELDAMSEWKTIESAPKDGTWFLAWENDTIPKVITVYWRKHSRNKNGGWWTSFNMWKAQPTHWMPLPEPPQ
jgi:hypothetical protein